MSKAPISIYVRIVSIDGMRIAVSSTNPGDFGEIGEPPIKIEGIEIEGAGKREPSAKETQSRRLHLLTFTAKFGQNLKSLQLNKRYKLTSA
jgi:hypothetical protein